MKSIPAGGWTCEWLFKCCASCVEVHPHCFGEGMQALEADDIKFNDKLNKAYDLNSVCSSTISKK